MMPDGQPDLSGLVDRRIALAREWDDLVEQVRALDGFADFLKPPGLETLLPAADKGPVVIVNVSQWRCDALIVQRDGVTVRELPRLSARETANWVNDYLGTLQRAERASDVHHDARRQAKAGGTMAHRQAAYRAEIELREARSATEAMLTELLGWLWDVIAEPVLAQLGYLDTPESGALWPRLWWCPTGPLTLLPLHAAGYHDRADGAPRTVMDRVVSSYTPTLRALVEARKPLSLPESSTERLLVVAMPETPGERALEGVAHELDLLTRLLPEDRLTLLQGADATREAVRGALPRHRWAHFSCHGDQKLDDPSSGGLLLEDGMLTVADISAGRYHAEFAGLSACKTATGGVNLPDEAISLAAALHYTGYRHVVGTLWSVQDVAGTAAVFDSVYRGLVADGRLCPKRSALALHQATRALRDSHRETPSLWTPFTHTGP